MSLHSGWGHKRFCHCLWLKSTFHYWYYHKYPPMSYLKKLSRSLTRRPILVSWFIFNCLSPSSVAHKQVKPDVWKYCVSQTKEQKENEVTTIYGLFIFMAGLWFMLTCLRFKFVFFFFHKKLKHVLPHFLEFTEYFDEYRQSQLCWTG